MNDPHVERLHYRIEHAEHVDYAKAATLDIEQPCFNIRVGDGRAVIELKTHCTSVDEAKIVVEPFLRAWEVDMALRYRPRALSFVYDRTDIIDRQPTRQMARTGHLNVILADVTLQAEIKTCVSFANFPRPTGAMECDQAVERMYTQYTAHLDGKLSLAQAAYFCLTAIEERGGKVPKDRHAGAAHYSISQTVLKMIGTLTGNKGGPFARKASGADKPFSRSEEEWLMAAMKLLIRRAAEVAFDPNGERAQLTMDDLPTLK